MFDNIAPIMSVLVVCSSQIVEIKKLIVPGEKSAPIESADKDLFLPVCTGKFTLEL